MAIVGSIAVINDQESSILVEVEKQADAGYNYQDLRAPVSQTIQKVGDLLGSALALVNKCAARIHEAVSAIDKEQRPQEYAVQLGIKLDAEMGAVIAKTSGGAQLQVTLKWVERK